MVLKIGECDSDIKSNSEEEEAADIVNRLITKKIKLIQNQQLNHLFRDDKNERKKYEEEIENIRSSNIKVELKLIRIKELSSRLKKLKRKKKKLRKKLKTEKLKEEQRNLDSASEGDAESTQRCEIPKI